MYGSRLTPQRVRAVLEAIEIAKRKRFQETEQLTAKLSVEHILPSDWKDHWPLPDGERATRFEIDLAGIHEIIGTQQNDCSHEPSHPTTEYAEQIWKFNTTNKTAQQ